MLCLFYFVAFFDSQSYGVDSMCENSAIVVHGVGRQEDFGINSYVNELC